MYRIAENHALTFVVLALFQHFADAVAVQVKYVEDHENNDCGKQYQENFLKEADPAGYARAAAGDGIELISTSESCG